MRYNGITVCVLPENAHCKADTSCRSPLDLDECPLEYEECSGDCYYYSEDEIGNEKDSCD